MRSRTGLLGLTLLCALSAAPTWGASKSVVAALGDQAPGDGVFVGPGFIGVPSAAGNGWVAFRTELVQGPSAEAIIVTNFVTRERRAISTGDDISPSIGRIRRFLGGPSVNASGQVAFAATVTPPDSEEVDPSAAEPAGIFVSDGEVIRRIAASGDQTAAGVLDLASAIDPEETVSDLPERTPALTDSGDVAFLASIGGSGAAILVKRAASDANQVVVSTATRFEGLPITSLGPPVMNDQGVLAFHARTRVPAATDPLGDSGGLFLLANGELERFALDGMVVHLEEPTSRDQALDGFDPALAINDAGDVTFTAGPVFDPRSSGDDGAQGVFVYHDGAVRPVATRGQEVDGVEIAGVSLDSDAGGAPARPQLLPDGTVVFFAEMDDGNSGRIASAAPPDYDIDTIVELSRSVHTPIGGTYGIATSPPAVDAAGAVSFSSRLAGTTISEALIHKPASGAGEAIGVGDAAPAPARGVLGGPPFSPPLLNDAGDVVFKSFVARGPALGIFRARDGVLEALVRILDVAPVESDGTGSLPEFIDLVGEPSLNAQGEIAFAGWVEGRGLGIFAAGLGGVRRVAVKGDPIDDPTRHGPFVNAVTKNPAIMDDGAVVFGATIRSAASEDPDSRFQNERGVLIADESGIHVVAAVGDQSDVGLPFYRFRDPSAASVLFALRAPLGVEQTETTGLVIGAPGGLSVVLREGDDLGNGLRISELRGRPGLSAGGETVTLARVTDGADTKVAILDNRSGVTRVVARTGDPGPVGGILRSIGRPSMSSDGGIVFRGTFEPGSGGTTTLFTIDGDVLHPHLVVGEQPPAEVGGRITGLGQDASLNAAGHLAFRATVSGGSAGQMIGLASQTAMLKSRVQVRLGLSTPELPEDKLGFTATVQAGDTSDGFDPGNDAVTVALSDSEVTLWSVTIPKGALVARRQGAKLDRDRRPGSLRKLRVRTRRKGRIQVSGKSAKIDLTQSGQRRVVPPLSMRVDLGDDSAITQIDCKQKGNRLVCR